METTALDTVAAVMDQLAGEVGDDSGSLAITKDRVFLDAFGVQNEVERAQDQENETNNPVPFGILIVKPLFNPHL